VPPDIWIHEEIAAFTEEEDQRNNQSDEQRREAEQTRKD